MIRPMTFRMAAGFANRLTPPRNSGVDSFGGAKQARNGQEAANFEANRSWSGMTWRGRSIPVK